MTLQTTADNLPDWARRGSKIESAEEAGVLGEHFPEQPVKNADGICDPASAEPVLSFRDDDLYYLLRGSGRSYALLRRCIEDNDKKAVLAGILTGVFVWLSTSLALIDFANLHGKTFGEVPAFAVFFLAGLVVLPGALASLFKRLYTTTVSEPELVGLYQNQEAALKNDRVSRQVLSLMEGKDGQEAVVYDQVSALFDEARSTKTIVS